jgi:putative restriction endonuclease
LRLFVVASEDTALVRAYVGVTDQDWYSFLADRPNLDEANFWRPGGGKAFRALDPGELFLFKTHWPHNRVVGGGFFSGFAALRISEAWDYFGEGNGVANVDEMRRRVGRYRKEPIRPGEDPTVGCVLIRDVRFFGVGGEADAPPEFASNVVQGKTYDLADSAHNGYFLEVLDRLLGHHVDLDVTQPWRLSGPVYGDPRLAPQRLGQQAFRAVVLDAYSGRCAVTGDRVRPVLEAAHIRPLPSGGEHRLDNGLLLRSDVHTLYDRGYVGVDPKHRLLVSPSLREEFGNGEQLYARAGQPVAVPDRRADRPSREFLEWHLDEVFKAS